VLQVLLAEDNAVNRELAITVLRKMGHNVVSVVNGQQALAAWEAGGFDLILMDVQMPSMDGLEATSLIREREKGTGRHIPIIGLTAHAMTGDREHGLAAGMDEYVTKPIHLDDLMRAVRKWSEVPVPTAGKPPTFRPEKLLKSLGGDNAALRRLVKIYLDTTPPLMDKLITSQAQGDTAALLHAAHTLKGSLTQLDCRDAAALAAVIEAKARVGDIEGLAPQILELQQRVNQLQASVGGWLGPEPVSV